RDTVRRPIERFHFENVTIFRPNVKAASHAAIRADCLRTADAQLPHVRLGFRELQNRAIARLRLDALHYIDHAAQRRLWQGREECIVAGRSGRRGSYDPLRRAWNDTESADVRCPAIFPCCE